MTDASPTAEDRRAAIGFWLLISIIVGLGVGKAVRSDVMDPDAFWHIRVAEQLLAEGIGPIVDQLSYGSIKEPWTPYSWLAELGMKWIWDGGGFRLALLVRALMVAATVIFVALACVGAMPASPMGREGDANVAPTAQRRLCAVVGTALFAYLSLPYLSFRPATAAIMLMALSVWLLLRDRRMDERSRAVWWVVPVTALTVNFHMTAVVIPMWVAALLGGAVWERMRRTVEATPASRSTRSVDALRDELAAAPRRDAGVASTEARERRDVRRYAIMLALTSLACLATPLLPGVIEAAWHYQSRDVMVASELISEMQPIWRGDIAFVTIGLIALLLVGAWRGRAALRMGEWLMLLIALVLMLRLGRFAPMFGMIAGPVAAATMPRLSDKPLSRWPVHVVMGLALISFAWRVIGAFPARDADFCQWLNRPHLKFSYPCEAAKWVDASIPPPQGRSGRLINEFNWGGYLAWRLGPRYQTLLDGRTQMFTEEFWKSTLLAPDDQVKADFLARQDADVAIVPVGKSAFRAALERLNWQSVYRDDVAEVLLPPAVSATQTTSAPARR